MGRTVIEARGLAKTYSTGAAEVQALKGVDFHLEEGDFVAVMGPSGSGKSTFLNLLGCLDRPGSGSYVLDGTDVSTMGDDELAAVRSRFIGFVFQGFNLLSRTTAEGNVELPLIYAGGAAAERPGRRLLEAVGLPERWSHSPGELSGGEQQRVAIARSLVNSPALILADEPTGNLDSKTGDEIMELFLGLNRAGLTIVMVTHEEEIAAYARRILRFKDGLVVRDEAVSSPHGPGGAFPGLPGFDPARLGLAARHGEAPEGRGAPAGRRGFTAVELGENLASAWRSLFQNKLRSALTILGILIGVGAVIAMVSVGQGATLSVQARIQSLGANFLTITPGSANVGGARQGFGSASSLTIDDADAIRRGFPELSGVEPEATARAQLKYRSNNWSTQVLGTSPDYPDVRNWAADEGSFFSLEDYRAKRSVVVLGRDTASNLFGDEDPIGKMVKIGDSSFRVLGLLQRKGAGGGFFSQDDTAIVPWTTLNARFRHQKDLRSIGLTVADKGAIESTKAALGDFLRLRHRLPDQASDDFAVVSQQDVLQTIQGVSSTMTLLLGSIAGISLLVGGIGIMNIMLVSVTERTREIGIRKALGARRRDILAQFLVEATILSGLGGLLGWGMGAVAARLISVLGNMPVSIGLGTVGLALGFSLAIGLFFGIYPARKAARMDPIQALRYE
jgi:macrolide transport system ATP-binding/permease protein